MIRRVPTALAVLSLALLSAGCSTAADADRPVAEAPAPANTVEELAPAAVALRDGDFAFTVESPGTIAEGVVHRPSGSAAFTSESPSPAQPGIVVVGADLWVELFGDWNHYTEGATEHDVAAYRADLTGVVDLLSAVTDATADGDTVTGTVDATRLRGDQFVDPQQVAEMGAAATSIPFEATLDAGKRLTALAIDMPKTTLRPAARWTLTFTGYGSQQPVAAPSQLPAP